jgi:hypothetical protein
MAEKPLAFLIYAGNIVPYISAHNNEPRAKGKIISLAGLVCFVVPGTMEGARDR